MRLLAKLIKHTRSLRYINLSHSLDLENLDADTIDKIAKAISINDSLT